MFAERIDPKGPLPNGEGKLRRLLEGIQSGKPDYRDMDPTLAQLIQRNLPRLHATSEAFGPIQSVTFLEALSPGWDIYEVRCDHGGTLRWRIALGRDGKIWGAVPIDLPLQSP